MPFSLEALLARGVGRGMYGVNLNKSKLHRGIEKIKVSRTREFIIAHVDQQYNVSDKVIEAIEDQLPSIK